MNFVADQPKEDVIRETTKSNIWLDDQEN